MTIGDTYRRLDPSDQLIFSSSGLIAGFRSGTTGDEMRPVSGTFWNLATSGTWRPAAIGALPRLFVSGDASGGTWALSYRNAAGTVTADPAEAIAANTTDVVPVYLDDATEIMVTITGTATVESK